MVGVDGLAPGGDAARDVEAGLAREESSDSLDVAPDGSVRPAESATLGAFGRDDDDHLAVAEVVEDLVRERSASARRGRASKSKTGADAKTPPRARPRAEPKPRPAVNVSPSVFRPPIRVVHASRGDPSGHDDDANDDGVRDDARASGAANVPREDGVGVGIETGDDAAVESSRRRGRVVPPSRILDARVIMDARGVPSVRVFPREPHRSSPRRRGRGGTSGPLVARVALTRRRQRPRGGRRRRVGVPRVASRPRRERERRADHPRGAVRVTPRARIGNAGDASRDASLASLSRLDLSFNALDHRCLATLSALAALERLNLSDNRVDELPANLFARHDEDACRAFEDGLDADAGAYRDGAFTPFPSLRRLRLSRQTPRLTSRRCDWVATLARLPKLARLSVDGNALDGVRAGSNPTNPRAATFRPGTDFPRLVALNLAGNPVRRVDALAALTPLAATTRRRDARETNATFGLRRERIRTDGVREDDSSSDGSDDEGNVSGNVSGNVAAHAGRLEEIHIQHTPLGEALAEEGDREGLRRAFAFGGSSRRSARARGRAEALASGALTTTRRARFGDGECDAVAAPLAGALVATLEPARSLPNAESLTLKPLNPTPRNASGFRRRSRRRASAPRRRRASIRRRRRVRDARGDAQTRRFHARRQKSRFGDVLRRRQTKRRRREKRAPTTCREPLRTRSNLFERVASSRTRRGRARNPHPSPRDARPRRRHPTRTTNATRSRKPNLAEPEPSRDPRGSNACFYPGRRTRSTSRSTTRRKRPGRTAPLPAPPGGFAPCRNCAARFDRARRRARMEIDRPAYARATAATTAKTTPTARLTSARRRVDAEGRARVRTVEEILRRFGVTIWSDGEDSE